MKPFLFQKERPCRSFSFSFFLFRFCPKILPFILWALRVEITRTFKSSSTNLSVKTANRSLSSILSKAKGIVLFFKH